MITGGHSSSLCPSCINWDHERSFPETLTQHLGGPHDATCPLGTCPFLKHSLLRGMRLSGLKFPLVEHERTTAGPRPGCRYVYRCTHLCAAAVLRGVGTPDQVRSLLDPVGPEQEA